ncbi:MAG: methylated-DNA--[protein]-cysteine S-methyltransferase [Thermaurantiacus sp.]
MVRTDAAGALTHARFHDDPDLPEGSGPVADAFRRWFAGDLQALDHLPLAPAGSVFQRSVWAELSRIPPGETRSYAAIARALGGAASGTGPNARAVGAANAQNPVAIAIPCHRVIGADGRLTGYAGGLARKAWLLAHEGWAPAQQPLF